MKANRQGASAIDEAVPDLMEQKRETRLVSVSRCLSQRHGVDKTDLILEHS